MIGVSLTNTVFTRVVIEDRRRSVLPNGLRAHETERTTTSTDGDDCTRTVHCAPPGTLHARGVVPAVHHQDFGGDGAAGVADEEHRRLRNFRRFDGAPQRRAVAIVLQDC